VAFKIICLLIGDQRIKINKYQILIIMVVDLFVVVVF
jgi:hypothetical protein